MEEFDLLIIGGGINGAGIARDAAGRGLRVILVEQDDLASHTSSASTKLIHGGLRYLEYGEFRLVRESLIERERLLGLAPHIIWPLSFVLPQSHSPRPAWMVRLGLFLYDHIGGRKRLPATQTIQLDQSHFGEGLAEPRGKAFVYADCWVDDARLVALNALDAFERGATILTRTRFLGARRDSQSWIAQIADGTGMREVRAKVIVNAAGPWVGEVMSSVAGVASKGAVKLVKGSHIILPKLYEGKHAFMLQNADRRVVFAIPYEGAFTLIGTTEEPWADAPTNVAISKAETDYLLATANRYFERKAGQQDIAWSYAGIRPLYDDQAKNATAATRDYVLDVDRGASGLEPALLNIFGGKITTYRKLAENALAALAGLFPGMGPAWTAGTCLPGGDIADGDFEGFVAKLERDFPKLSQALLRRLARAYGTRTYAVLGKATDAKGLGADLGGGLSEAEVAYLAKHEWAKTAEDILYRRSKLGLHAPADTAGRIEAKLAVLEMAALENARAP